MKTFLKYIATGVIAIAGFSACKKDFIEAERNGVILEGNYYRNAQEAFSGVVAAYDPLGMEAGGIGNTYTNRLGPLNAASDDCYAGGAAGGSDMNTWQAWNNYTLDPANGPQGSFWSRNYTGVFRTNLILGKLANATMDANLRARFIGEVKFLRAYYYFELVRLFKNIPLFTAPVPIGDVNTQAQAKAEDVFKQIEKDLTDAIAALPPTVPISTEGGRATQGAAKALLAKVIIWQNNNSRMMEAANLLEDVNKVGNAYGYALQNNFGDIFRPDNKFNSESIFEIVHTSKGNGGWGGWPNFDGNVAVQMFGPRAYSGPKYEAGWGFNPITLSLVNALKGDPRYKFTVANIDSLKNIGQASYEASHQNTGYFLEKYAPLKQWKSTGGGNAELNYPNDVIEIRLADTYLMQAEALIRGGGDATKAAFYLNAVRARVGLGPVAATLDNIYEERRLELATEGHRWFDLVRTGRAAQVLGFKGFKAGKHELLPIPQIELNNTILVQNPNY